MPVETWLLERSAQAVTPFPATLPAPQSGPARKAFKDPYRFDFLGLGDDARERHSELAPVHLVTVFLLEPGAGFAFVGRQVLPAAVRIPLRFANSPPRAEHNPTDRGGTVRAGDSESSACPSGRFPRCP